MKKEKEYSVEILEVFSNEDWKRYEELLTIICPDYSLNRAWQKKNWRVVDAKLLATVCAATHMQPDQFRKLGFKERLEFMERCIPHQSPETEDGKGIVPVVLNPRDVSLAGKSNQKNSLGTISFSKIWPSEELQALKATIIKKLEKMGMCRTTAYNYLRKCQDTSDPKTVNKSTVEAYLRSKKIIK